MLLHPTPLGPYIRIHNEKANGFIVRNWIPLVELRLKKGSYLRKVLLVVTPLFGYGRN